MFELGRVEATKLVAQIDYHDTLGSTSDRAVALGAEGTAELPLLVLTERQTAGRGRGSNRWWTSDGALTFSLVLHAPADALPPDRWPQVALVAGIAVCEALEELAPGAELSLKWPNDVFLTGRKVAGILSESVPGWRDRLVAGIGVNVNNRVQGSGDRSQGAPTHHSLLEANLPATAISLIDHDGIARDLTSVLIAILDRFDQRWQMLLRGDLSSLAAAYRERCLLTGKTVAIEQPGGQRIVGVCRGIDRSGRLQLVTDGGAVSIASGTVVGWE